MKTCQLPLLFLGMVVGCGEAATDKPQSIPGANRQLPLDEQARVITEPVNDNNKTRDGRIPDTLEEFTKPTVETVTGTGVKESILLTMINTNPLPAKRYQHKFEYKTRDGDVMIYKDEFNPLYLRTVGPPDDLTLIELMMPVNDFAAESSNGELSTNGAAAFGRCVQRVTLAVDPNWTGELYDWMNSQMAVALVTKEGATVSRKGLIVRFRTTTLSNDVMMLNFTITAAEGSHK